MTDLPRDLRDSLAELGLGQVLAVTDVRRAQDGTRKLLARLGDGATVETVLIPGLPAAPQPLPSPISPLDGDVDDTVDDDEDDGPANRPVDAAEEGHVRVAQCISTQVGCAMGCAFCASGVAGWKRNLGADEIVAQVIAGRSRLESGERLRSVVFMGMGEPLHNYDATVRAIRLLSHSAGVGLSTRRITVSTSGLIPEIARLGREFDGHIGLAVSLHAADDETRSRLMPVNRKYSLGALIAALRAYPLPRRRRITIEYALIAGRNDRASDATKLARLLRGIPVKVNLIPMNQIVESDLRPPSMAVVLAFQRVLCERGYSCFIRRRRGADVDAACGQLALLGAQPRVRVARDA
jgi:23S rRNA (adenine2503-C2)-methyltransferase